MHQGSKACAVQQMQSKRQTLMDSFEYVMFGRIFKYEDTPSGASNQVRSLVKATAAILRYTPPYMSLHATKIFCDLTHWSDNTAAILYMRHVTFMMTSSSMR